MCNDLDRIDERWVVHFLELINRPRSSDRKIVPDIPFP